MSKRKLVVASIALTGCLCWAFASSIAETPAQPVKTSGSSSISTTDPIANHVNSLTDSGVISAPGIARVDPIDSYDQSIPVRMVDPSKVFTIDHPVYTETMEEAAARVGVTCTAKPYKNGPQSQISYFIFGGAAPNNNEYDDCSLDPGNGNKFICAAQEAVLGAAGGGPPMMNYRMQVWTDCPENPGAILVAQGDFLNIPNDFNNHIITLIIDPPFKSGNDTFWVGNISDNPDASLEIANNTTSVGDVGNTANLFAVLNGVGDCSDNLFLFGAPTWSGFTITLYGSVGNPGSCCDLNSGTCTDGVLLGACNDFLNQAWSQSNGCGGECVACAVTCPASGGANLENETDCTTNYVDTTNRGCQNLTAFADTFFFTPVSCGVNGCGRSGTYSFTNNYTQNGATQSTIENRRDDDHYKIELTQDTRVTWTVRGKFPADAIISFGVRQTNSITGPLHCVEFISTAVGDNSFVTAAGACQDAVATALLAGRNDPGSPPTNTGPFRYMLRARPKDLKLGDNALCGLPYTVNLYCETGSESLPTGACCTETINGNFCTQTSSLGCLIFTGNAGFYQGDTTTCPSTCTGTPANDICTNSTVLTCTSCTLPYDTTFAHGEGQSLSQGGVVAKDVWFEYKTPVVSGCSQGRVTVANIYACFNSKIQMMKLKNCNDTQTNKCNLNSSLLPPGGIRGTLTQLQLLAGPPIVNLGPWVYGKGTNLAGANECWKIRVGGLTEDDFGAAVLRIDYVCQTPTDGTWAWAQEAGRCCFWNDATQTGNCMVTPLTGTGATTNGPDCCAKLGGYLTNTTDFYEGASGPQSITAVDVSSVGCASLPCPAPGEACYNAYNLNNLLTEVGYSGGFGTVTRLTRNKLYFKYTVPSVPLNSGIVLSACGSSLDPNRPGVFFFDTAIGIWKGFNMVTGFCENHDLSAQGPVSTTLCGTSVSYDNSEMYRGDDCNQTDPRSLGAQGNVSCYSIGEVNPCLCLKVVNAPIPGQPQVASGQTIYIGLGIKNVLPDSFRPFTDPVRSDPCVATSRLMQLQVSSVAQCFTCSIACPGGTTPEGENYTGGATCQDYVDNWDAGCAANSVANMKWLPVTCGQTYCANSATYRINKSCTVSGDCDLGDTCDPSLVCTGPNDNTQDFDYYTMTLTQAKRLTWTVNATFPATAQIFASTVDPNVSPALSCSKAVVLANAVNASQCSTTVAAADVCPGVGGTIYIYLVVFPTNSIGVPCSGSIYYANLTCSSPSASGTCCKGDMDNNGVVNGKDIPLWITQVLPSPVGQPAIALNPAGGCYDVATCRGDFTGDFKVDLADVSGFVAALLSGGACSATACGDSAACHSLSDDDVGVVSDRSTAFGGGFRVTDDFKVTSPGVSQSLNKLCWYGFYFNYNILGACVNPLGDSADSFKITIYNDQAGLPGTVLAGPLSPSSLVKTNTGNPLTYLSRTVTRIKYECDIVPAVTVTNGGCYWLEIQNQTTGACLWHWETSKLSGNAVSLQQAGGYAPGTSNYYSYNLATDDFAFCLPGLRISSSDCGLPQGLCCVYPASPPSCPSGINCLPWQATTTTSGSRPYCEQILGGRWFPLLNIAGPCPLLPRNDDCVNAILVTSGPIYTGSIIYATTDGPAMSCEQSCSNFCNAAPDVWYKWVASISGNATFSMCDTWVPGALGPQGEPIDVDLLWRYDAMMVVYDKCPADGGVEMSGGCNDDASGCAAGASTISKVTITTAVAGNTYWARISGWKNGRGNFVFRVNQP